MALDWEYLSCLVIVVSIVRLAGDNVTRILAW